MAQTEGRCLVVWHGVGCGYEGVLVKHHHYRPDANGLDRGPPHHQHVCKSCQDRAHDAFKGRTGGPDDKWPENPFYDGINAPFLCGDLPVEAADERAS